MERMLAPFGGDLGLAVDGNLLINELSRRKRPKNAKLNNINE